MGQSRPSELNLDPRKPYRFPDDDEYTICSRIRDVIPRDSGRFRKILIRNTNDQADYANDDWRRMTSRAKSKLDILASLVHTKWAGRVKVKVLLAWTDQIDPADRVSLHYEGKRRFGWLVTVFIYMLQFGSIHVLKYGLRNTP